MSGNTAHNTSSSHIGVGRPPQRANPVPRGLTILALALGSWVLLLALGGLAGIVAHMVMSAF